MVERQENQHSRIQKQNTDTEFASEFDAFSPKNPVMNAIQEMYSQTGISTNKDEKQHVLPKVP